MRSGATALRHERKQAKAAARRVTGAAVVRLSSRMEGDSQEATLHHALSAHDRRSRLWSAVSSGRALRGELQAASGLL